LKNYKCIRYLYKKGLHKRNVYASYYENLFTNNKYNCEYYINNCIKDSKSMEEIKKKEEVYKKNNGEMIFFINENFNEKEITKLELNLEEFESHLKPGNNIIIDLDSELIKIKNNLSHLKLKI
jgi:hypothetical protein